MANPVLVRKLAREFTRVLRTELSGAEWAEMRDRNRDETDPSVCHSHDFCDANMAMDEAFRNVTGRPAKAADPDDQALWNAAWDEAKATDMTEARK